MKKVLLGLLVLGAIASCKKDDDNNCEKSVNGIAGNYKLTKYEVVTGPQTSDQTTTNFDACELSAVYAFKTDKTFTYTETGSGCSDSFSGTWDVVDGKLRVNDGSFTIIDNLPITSWDCSNLVVSDITSTAGGDIGTRTTLRKQ